MIYLRAFLCGAIICGLSQVLIDRTKLTPARILSGYVVAGLVLTALGIYGPIVRFGGAGATVPILGFGYTMAEATAAAVREHGLLGALLGGLQSTAAGIAAAVTFSFLASFIFRSRDKS